MSSRNRWAQIFSALTRLLVISTVFTLAACDGGGSTQPAPVDGGNTPPSTNSFTVGGSVLGLTGSGLVLQNNGANNLAISTNGNFSFSTALTGGSTYSVTVATPPSGQTCTLTNGSGTINGANITDVQVTCTTAPTLSLSANPTSVTSGDAAMLSWSSTGATGCTASGGWSGAITPVASGSRSTGALTANTSFTLMCTGAGGSVNRSVTVNVVPVDPGTSGVESALLNFAEIWSQNWNFGGHSVDAQFTANYGSWTLDETTYEPWLFDRTSVAYYLYTSTGDTRWRDLFFTYFAFYRTHIDAGGIFTPKGGADTKYSYVTPFLLYERATGDMQYRPVAKRIYDAWAAELPDDYSTSISLWTEREIGLALEAAVSYYELTLDAPALARARKLLNHWDQACGTSAVPLHTLEQHGEEFGNAWAVRRMTSPWMAGLYFQAAMRLHRLTGDTQPLQQLSRYADWLDLYAFVDAAVVHPEHAGYIIPYYLVGEELVDGSRHYTPETPDWGDADHAYDVGNLLQAAVTAKTKLALDTTAVQARRVQLQATALHNFNYWTRTATFLPKYRLSPPRKFNWWYRSRTLLEP